MLRNEKAKLIVQQYLPVLPDDIDFPNDLQLHSSDCVLPVISVAYLTSPQTMVTLGIYYDWVKNINDIHHITCSH